MAKGNITQIDLNAVDIARDLMANMLIVEPIRQKREYFSKYDFVNTLRSEILELRSKGYTYAEIVSEWDKIGVSFSEAALRTYMSRLPKIAAQAA